MDDRSPSGRAIRLRLPGLQPAVIAGNQFRAAIGTTILRSTAFSIDRRGTLLRFTGRGYGHGVGMCVIGAGRRAARGESGRAILARYYPGLEVARLDGVGIGGVGVEVPRLAARAHDDLANMLGTSVAAITVRVHELLEGFRLATGQPWWVRSVSAGTSIDLVPAALRIAIAELLVSEELRGRPVWVRVGAARYFARNGPRTSPPATGTAESGEECPPDAELTLAISAPAQRAVEARAEGFFAREYARIGDWRTVR